MATRGLADFVVNALVSMERAGVDPNFVEIVLPADAKDELTEIARAFGAQPRILEQLIEVAPLDMPTAYAEYGSPEFAHVERYRFPALRRIMAEGKRVIYADVDVAWLRNPLPYLSDVLDNYACAMQTEAMPVFPPVFCLGFLALADTPAAFRLVDHFVARYSAGKAWKVLQPVFRDMVSKKPGFLRDIFPLPEGLFPNGLLRCLVRPDMAAPGAAAQDLQPFLLHGNWVTGLAGKRQLLDDAGLWLAAKDHGRVLRRVPIPLFSVADFLSHNGVEVTAPDVQVVTRGAEWSYALSFLPDRAVLQSIGDDQEMMLHIELRVDEGVVGVGLLQSDGRGFITEKQVGPGRDFRAITLRAPASARFSEIVLRNRSELGMPSRATVRAIETRLSPRSAG
jgi:hypothetical protein